MQVKLITIGLIALLALIPLASAISYDDVKKNPTITQDAKNKLSDNLGWFPDLTNVDDKLQVLFKPAVVEYKVTEPVKVKKIQKIKTDGVGVYDKKIVVDTGKLNGSKVIPKNVPENDDLNQTENLPFYEMVVDIPNGYTISSKDIKTPQYLKFKSGDRVYTIINRGAGEVVTTSTRPGLVKR